MFIRISKEIYMLTLMQNEFFQKDLLKGQKDFSLKILMNIKETIYGFED